MIAFHRWADGGVGDDVVVVINLSHQGLTDYVVGMPYAGTWRLLLNSDASVYSPDFADTTQLRHRGRRRRVRRPPGPRRGVDRALHRAGLQPRLIAPLVEERAERAAKPTADRPYG